MMPYLYREAARANEAGTPMMRAMMLEFPDDPACDYLDRQYMLGDAVMVAPVFSEAGDVEFYLPEGRWTHLWRNDEVQGSRWHKQQHDFLSLPVYVRDNTLLALGNNSQKPITPGMRVRPSSYSIWMTVAKRSAKSLLRMVRQSLRCRRNAQAIPLR